MGVFHVKHHLPIQNSPKIWSRTSSTSVRPVIRPKARNASLRSSAARRAIAGQRIGDRERSWGETNAFTLPNSGIGMTFSTGLHDVAEGCWRRHCYWTDFFYNVAVGRLDPELPVPESWRDYRAGRDAVLAAVLELEGAATARP